MISVHAGMLIRLEASVRDAIAAIGNSRCGIALVVDEERKLIGLVTDRDLRLTLLGGASLSQSVEPYVNRTPVVAMVHQPREEIFEIMRRTGRSPVPLLDSRGSVVGLESLSSVLRPGGLKDCVAVIMAGGMGVRLHPLTLDRPKPMLPVRGRPILQNIMENLRVYGFRRIYLAVHFRRETIEEYFGDGKQLGLEIEYLRETQPLGTAGALALLSERPEQPFVVMNGDLLTHMNMESLMDHHVSAGRPITICVRPYEVQIPYGVVKLEGSRVVGLDEKPVKGFFVNAGIYVLDPQVLDLIEEPKTLDMPELVNRAIAQWGGINSFPILDYWLDVGKHEEYNKAVRDYRAPL